MQFGKSKAKLASKGKQRVTFKDVAGVDEAVEELREIEEFLENAKVGFSLRLLVLSFLISIDPGFL